MLRDLELQTDQMHVNSTLKKEPLSFGIPHTKNHETKSLFYATCTQNLYSQVNSN